MSDISTSRRVQRNNTPIIIDTEYVKVNLYYYKFVV